MPRWWVTVPGWRELVVEKVHIEPTYLGFLEGTTESINQRLMLQSLPRRAGIMVGATSEDEVIPFYTRPLAASALKRPLPDFACLALLYSTPVKNETLDDDTISSRCVYGWFTNDLSAGMEELLRTGIRRFAWEKHAVNCWL
jgi:hypothetical protein